MAEQLINPCDCKRNLNIEEDIKIKDLKPTNVEIDKFPISFSYADLMYLLRPGLKTEGIEDENLLKLIKAIEKVTVFDVTDYAIVEERVAGIVVDRYIDEEIVYNQMTVNGISLGDVMRKNKSVSFYNAAGLEYTFEYYTHPETISVLISIDALNINDEGELYTERKELYIKFNIAPAEEEEEEEEQTPEDEDRPSTTEKEVIPVNPASIPSSDITNEVPDEISHVDIVPSIIHIEPEYAKYSYINSVSLYELHNPSENNPNIKAGNGMATITTNDNFVRIHFNERHLEPMQFDMTITATRTSVLGEKNTKRTNLTFKYEPNLSSVSGNEYPRIQKMNTPNVSYALLRTNPKLTGNVKVVVDSKNNIYLDTFKVSKSLEQKRFRHVKVNSNEYYGQTLMTKYKDVPTTDFYKIEDKCYNLFTTAQTYNSQYYDLYRYGVKTNDDKMYSENFALLAPLCIKEVIPDFFVIFKVDTTASDYDESWDDTTKMKYFLKNGKVVKSYDMRKDSVLGEYVRTIYNRSNEYPGDAYLSYSATNHNKFIGISVERGVVTSAYESTFKEEGIQSQVAMNDFYTEGFERNHLVSKNIINFEFMFNDTDAELFSIDTYFGLYVRVNTEDEDYSCIGKKELKVVSDSEEESEEVETETIYSFDTSIHSFNFRKGKLADSSVYEGVMYALTTPKEFIRLNEGVKYSPAIEDYVLKPYKNVLSTEVKKVDASTCKSFLSFKLNNLLELGDHIRIVDIANQTIYEVVTTNVDNYTDNRKISDVTTTYARVHSAFYTIKYVSIFINSRKDNEFYIGTTEEAASENPTFADVLVEQTEQLFYAFKKFESPAFSPFKYDGNYISILGKRDALVFERICSPSGFTDEQKVYLEENETENETIEFFDGVYPDKLILNVDNTNWEHSTYIYLYPLHFEVVGNRIAHAISFVPVSAVGEKYLYAATVPSPDVFDYKTLIYNSYDEDGNIVSAKYNKISFASFVQGSSEDPIEHKKKEVNYVPSFYNDGTVFLNLRDPYTQNNTFNLYNSYPLNSGICSFFNLKDFDFAVLDNDSYIAIEENSEKIGEKGEFAEKTLFNTEVGYSEDRKPTADPNGMYFYYYGVDGNIPEGFVPLHNVKVFYHLPYGQNFVRIMMINGDELVFPSSNELDYASTVVYQPYINGTTQIDYSQEIADYVFEYNVSSENSHKSGQNGNFGDTHTAAEILNSLFFIPYRIIVKDEDDEEIENYPAPEPTEYTLASTVRFCKKSFDEMGNPVASELQEDTLDSFITHLQMNLVDLDATEAAIEYDTSTNLAEGWDPAEASKYLNGYRFAWDWDYNITEGVGSKSIRECLSSENLWMFLYIIGGWKNTGELIPDESAVKIDSSYSLFPIRNTSEENIKDYIDKYRSFYNDASGNVIDISKPKVSTRYFNNLFENNHTKSDISLTSPHACKWKGVGTDARGKDMRVMHDFDCLVDSSSYYAAGSNTYSNYLGFLSYDKKNEDYPNEKKYISGTLNSLVESEMSGDPNLGITEKQYILSGNGNLEDILYDSNDSDNKFSVVYNAGEDTIEFISAGVKFRIKTNNNDAINLNNYNGYSVAFVSLPDINRDYPKQTELIIDETKREMMLIWYQATNTFEFGKVYEPMKNSYDLLNSIFLDRYICRIHHEENIRDISCVTSNNVDMMKLKDESKYGEEIVERGFRGRRLCRKHGGVWVGSVDSDDTRYSKYNRVVLTGNMHPGIPTRPDDADYLYSYYYYKNFISFIDPTLWHNEYQESANNTVIHNYCYDYNPSTEAFLITDDPTAIPSKIGTFNTLSDAVKSCAIYVKTAEGKKDYTTFANLLTITVIEPIKYLKYEGLGLDSERIDKKKEIELGYVHPSFVEPVTVDMFNFNYNAKESSGDGEETTGLVSKSLEDLFEKSFDGGNIVLSKVNPISQMWFNKYTEEFNYCIKKIEKTTDEIIYKTRTSLGFDHNVSIMKDSWNNKLYRNYSSVGKDTEHFNYVPGYKTGYELKTFIHSRGINLNGSDGNTVEIVSWKNTEISKKNNYIKLDITDSLVYNILFRPAFNKYWKYLNLSDNTYKINYIKNTILPLININNKTKFVLYKDSNLTKSLVFNSELDEANSEMIINYKNELKYENGKYYMYVYPEDTTQYYAKMIINL